MYPAPAIISVDLSRIQETILFIYLSHGMCPYPGYTILIFHPKVKQGVKDESCLLLVNNLIS